MKILIITWAYRLYVKVRRSRHRPGKAGDGQWCQVQRQLEGFLFFKFQFFFLILRQAIFKPWYMWYIYIELDIIAQDKTYPGISKYSSVWFTLQHIINLFFFRAQTLWYRQKFNLWHRTPYPNQIVLVHLEHLSQWTCNSV